MIAPRLLPRDEWERRLAALECRRLSAPGHNLETAEFWQTKGGALFTVPADVEGRIRIDDLQIVVAHVARLRPLDFSS